MGNLCCDSRSRRSAVRLSSYFEPTDASESPLNHDPGLPPLLDFHPTEQVDATPAHSTFSESVYFSLETAMTTAVSENSRVHEMYLKACQALTPISSLQRNQLKAAQRAIARKDIGIGEVRGTATGKVRIDDRDTEILILLARDYFVCITELRQVSAQLYLPQVTALTISESERELVIDSSGDPALHIKSESCRTLLVLIVCGVYLETGKLTPYRKVKEPCTSVSAQEYLDLTSFQSSVCLDLVLKHGDVGEVGLLLCQSLCVSTRLHSKECIFWMTDRAVYTLTRDFLYVAQFLLKSVVSLHIWRAEELIGFQTPDMMYRYYLPLDSRKVIEKAVTSATGLSLKIAWTVAAQETANVKTQQ